MNKPYTDDEIRGHLQRLRETYPEVKISPKAEYLTVTDSHGNNVRISTDDDGRLDLTIGGSIRTTSYHKGDPSRGRREFTIVKMHSNKED